SQNSQNALSWNTIDRRIRTAISFLKWCAKNGYIGTPAENFAHTRRFARGTFQRLGHSRKPIKTPTRFVDIDSALRFIRSIEKMSRSFSVRNVLIARLMLETGLRISEVISLPIDAVPEPNNNYHFGVTSVIGKGKKERPLPIPMALLWDVQAYQE